MRKWNQNLNRIASHYCNENVFAFSHFFASHSHRTTIPGDNQVTDHALNPLGHEDQLQSVSLKVASMTIAMQGVETATPHTFARVLTFFMNLVIKSFVF
jgi:hypothetical protein